MIDVSQPNTLYCVCWCDGANVGGVVAGLMEHVGGGCTFQQLAQLKIN